MRALAIAATGMNAQQTNVEVIANNIANINTTGFKRSRAEFTDLLYQVERAAGTPNRGGQDAVPEGAHIGLGVRTTAIRNLHMQGALTQHRQQARSGAQRPRLVPDRRRQQRAVLHARRLLQQERERADRHGGRLRRAAGADHSPERDRCRRQRDRPGLRPRRHRRHDAADRPAHARQLHQRGRPRPARRQSLSRDARPPARR